VRSYQDSDGDGLGDLNGLRFRLDYIEDMGWRGLWLMPIMPSPSYHKYDVTDYRAVDGQYGTLEDLRALAGDYRRTGMAGVEALAAKLEQVTEV
jgi:glycosidase